MKKIVSLILATVLAASLFSFAACNKGSSSNKLIVWTFTQELKTMVKDYYEKTDPGIEIEVQVTEVTGMVQKLDRALSTGKNLPDVVAIEEKYISKYAGSGKFSSLDDIKPADNQMYDYTIDAATDKEGHVMAYAWQATPGVFYYRSDMADKILGVKSPEEMQAKVGTWADVINVAKQLKNADPSTGFSDVRIFSDVKAPARAFFSNRNGSWIDANGKLSIEPQLYKGEDSLYELIKALQVGDGEWGGEEKPYINETTERESGWYADMSSDKVFAYLMPSYSLQYDLKKNAAGENDYTTAGKWAVIKGPANYSDGGTWLGVLKTSDKQEAAKKLIKYFTMDETFIRQWANDTGDFMNNKKIMEEFAADPDRGDEFLYGKQNQYVVFNEIAKSIKGNNRTDYDSTINEMFGEWAIYYAKLDNGVTDKSTAKKTALQGFITGVESAFRDIDVDITLDLD